MIRSLIIEHCVLPLASTWIRQKAPEGLTARSVLLYGPKGSGKSMLARAIATEAGAMFFDISPQVIEGKFNTGKQPTILIQKVFFCAQDMAPAVIYIDQIDLVFQAKAKGKKGGGGGDNPSRIKKDLQGAIKQVKRGPECIEQDRILFIGATSAPYEDTVDKKGLQESFDEFIWVSYPDYGSRVMLWQKFMEQHSLNSAIPPVLESQALSSLASVSDGYSAGSFKQTVDRVLTARRVQQLKNRPLQVQEFLGPLSRTAFCWPEDFKKFETFDYFITGEMDRNMKLREEEERLAAEAAGNKGKKK